MDHRGLLWIIVDYHGLSIIMDYLGLSWILDYGGLSLITITIILDYGLSLIIVGTNRAYHGLWSVIEHLGLLWITMDYYHRLS